MTGFKRTAYSLSARPSILLVGTGIAIVALMLALPEPRAVAAGHGIEPNAAASPLAGKTGVRKGFGHRSRHLPTMPYFSFSPRS